MNGASLEREVFKTGHPVFDHIVWLKHGMTVLITDETFSEGKEFLKALLKNKNDAVFELLSKRHSPSGGGAIYVTIESLQDLSIQVNQKRRSEKGKIFIHLYLPELLVRHKPDEVVKLIEIWQKEMVNSRTVEFFLLPRNTFEEFEKKFRAIADSIIDLSIAKSDKKFIYYFMPIRSCDPKFHLKQIRYEISGNRLFIEWDNILLDTLPTGGKTLDEIKDEIRKKIDKLVMNVSEINPETTLLRDYLFLAGLNGERLAIIKALYPDIWPELEEKIARWTLIGLVKLEEAEHSINLVKRNKLKLKNRVLLSTPASLAVKMITTSRAFLGRRVRTVPLDAYLAVLDAIKKVVDYTTWGKPEIRSEINFATYFFGELSARKTALEYIRRLEGTYETKFNVNDAPKLIAITLKVGWDLDINIKDVGESSWVFDVIKCHLCENIRSEEPFCDKFISSVVVGVLGVCFGRRAECSEYSCVATGGVKCSFRAKLKTEPFNSI